jgi:predicted nucleotidyltransferase
MRSEDTRIRRKHDAAIKESLQEYCKAIIKRFKPVCIILYGSRAKGTFTDKSDVDIIVISSNFNQDFLSRIKNLIDANTTMLPH